MPNHLDLTADILDAAEVMWRYLLVIHEPQPADFILCLGSHDTGVAGHAASLWHQGWAPRIIMSGGIAHQNDLAWTGWEQSEAEIFAETAASCGVPREAILLEVRARNTGENFTITRALLASHSLAPERLLVVAKPYMTRRGLATGTRLWPEIELRMQCERISLRDYLKRWPEPRLILNLMAGDLHRIIVYPSLGFQTYQEVPEAVFDALETLVTLGFGQHLVASFTPRGNVRGAL